MTQSIASEWTACLEGVTRRHLNDPVTIEVVGLDIGDQFEAQHVPLKGITLDVKDRPRGAVSILLESRQGGHTERMVHEPVSVQLKTDAEGRDEVLSIEGADGTTTFVKFDVTKVA